MPRAQREKKVGFHENSAIKIAFFARKHIFSMSICRSLLKNQLKPHKRNSGERDASLLMNASGMIGAKVKVNVNCHTTESTNLMIERGKMAFITNQESNGGHFSFNIFEGQIKLLMQNHKLRY